MSKFLRNAHHFAAQYNLLWVVYFIYTVIGQLIFLTTTFTTWYFFLFDICTAGIYCLILYSFVFKKKLFSPETWKTISIIVIVDLALTVFRMFIGDISTEQASICELIDDSACYLFLIPVYISLWITALPVYYALFRLVFPHKTLPLFHYPTVNILHNPSSNRFFAVPLLGILIKLFLLLPVYIFSFLLALLAMVLQFINYFVIAIRGKIWNKAYYVTWWSTTLSTRTYAYILGVTDRYPGFGSMSTDPLIKLAYEPPTRSSRALGFPVLGVIIRYILLLPFTTFISVIFYAVCIGMVVSWFIVLFTGKYPKSIRELSVDGLRMQAASILYLTAMSDKYPSFAISLSNPYKKIALILTPILLSFLSNL